MSIMDFKPYPHPASTKRLREMVGLPKKLPDGFRGPWNVQGYVVRLVSAEHARQMNNSTARKPHRLIVTCKCCGLMVGAGRLAQHEKPCEEQR